MEQTHYVFSGWALSSAAHSPQRLWISLFCASRAALFYLTPPPFHAPAGAAILCSSVRLFPSSLLTLPVVHRRAGSPPKSQLNHDDGVSPEQGPSPTSI